MAYSYIRLARQCQRILARVSRENTILALRNSHSSQQLNQYRVQKLYRELLVLRTRVLNALNEILRGERHLFSTTHKHSQDDGGSKSGRGSGDSNPEPGPIFTLLFSLMIIALFVLASVFVVKEQIQRISWEEFVGSYLANGRVLKLEVSKRTGIAKVRQKVNMEENVWFKVDSVETLEKDMIHAQQELGIHPTSFVPVHFIDPSARPQPWIVTLTLIALFALTFKRFMGKERIAELTKMINSRSPGGLITGMFYRSPGTLITKDTGVAFKDVAGCEEAKIEIMEFVNFLKNPQSYLELGAKIPKGALLNGPPGTGKTLLAKATAGEAGVPFIAASGSEFLEMFVGVGVQRIRSMFQMAKENAPCILFIDEIDALAVARSSGATSDVRVERENTLNQLLAEMDGFDTHKGVIVLAATNRVQVLDKALLRPGRFDRQIYVPSPDIKGRASIFKVYLKKLKTQVNQDEVARKMAALTPGLSGADIMNICNEAALIAVRNKSDYVNMDHFESALERVVAGMEKKTQVVPPAEKKKIAYHEAGKAVAGWFLEHAKPLLKVSIVPRNDVIGHSMYMPREQFLYTKEELLDRMCMDLGGVISHELFFGKFTTRSQKDLRAVTKLAYSLVGQFGMNEQIGQISFQEAGPEQISLSKPYSQSLAELIDTEANALITNAYERTRKLLTDHIVEVEKVAVALLEKEKLNKEALVEILGPRPYMEKTTYEELVEGTGSLDEDTTLPESLKNWNKSKSDKSEE